MLEREAISKEGVIKRLDWLRRHIDELDKEAQEEIRTRAEFYRKLFGELRELVDEGMLTSKEAREHTALSLATEEYDKTHDSLTGLLNKRVFDSRLAEEVSKAERSGEKLGLIILDTDNFGEVNKTIGHMAGDQILITIAEGLKWETRLGDVAARWGGDEFTIILPGIDEEGLQRFDERLKASIEKALQVTTKETNLPYSVTVTTGMGILRPKETVEDFFDRIDENLLANKAYEQKPQNLTKDL